MDELRRELAELSPDKRALLEMMLLKKAAAAPTTPTIPRVEGERSTHLSFAEQRLWFVDQLEPSHPFYNVPLAARLIGRLDWSAFQEKLLLTMNSGSSTYDLVNLDYTWSGSLTAHDHLEPFYQNLGYTLEKGWSKKVAGHRLVRMFKLLK